MTPTCSSLSGRDLLATQFKEYFCDEIVFAIFCWYFNHIDIGYECIVSSRIVEINLLTTYLLTDKQDQGKSEWG